MPKILSVVLSMSESAGGGLASLVDMTVASKPISSIASAICSGERMDGSCSARPSSDMRFTDRDIRPGRCAGETIFSIFATQEAHVIPLIDNVVLTVSRLALAAINFSDDFVAALILMGGNIVNSTSSSGACLRSGEVSCSVGVVSNPQSSIASTSCSSLMTVGSKLIDADELGSETDTFLTPSRAESAAVTDLTHD